MRLVRPVAWIGKGRGEMHAGVWWGSLREGNHLEDQGVDGRILLKFVFKKWFEGCMDWIVLAAGRWRVFVNVVINLSFP
jgi:hypothetical protein